MTPQIFVWGFFVFVFFSDPTGTICTKNVPELIRISSLFIHKNPANGHVGWLQQYRLSKPLLAPTMPTKHAMTSVDSRESKVGSRYIL